MIIDFFISLTSLALIKLLFSSYLYFVYKPKKMPENRFHQFFVKTLFIMSWPYIIRLWILKYNFCPYSFECFKTGKCYFWHCPYFKNEDKYLKDVNR